ncbi:MAG TPA: hypothetical protein VN081_05405 [Dongiaceae bacterium]|nr:hypothetical protein [Dongiaceae bacterium]
MAKVIANESQVIVEPWWVRGRIVFIGAGLGLVWWVLTSLLRHYVVEPLACQNLSSATACVDSFGVSGNIATVLVALLGTYILIRFVQPRPIVITLASAVLLWDIAAFMDGLGWFETLLWGIVLYAIAYTLFSLIARIRLLAVALAVAAVVVLVIRILIAL